MASWLMLDECPVVKVTRRGHSGGNECDIPADIQNEAAPPPRLQGVSQVCQFLRKMRYRPFKWVRDVDLGRFVERNLEEVLNHKLWWYPQGYIKIRDAIR